MSTTTTNYGLTKPDITDNYDIGVFNSNADAIDAALKANADASTGREAALSSAAAKDAPADADSVALVDSADGNQTKRVLWSGVKSTLQTAFSPVFAALSHTHAWSAITGKPESFPPSAHAHAASDITSGAIPVAHGGTGGTTAAAGLFNLISALSAAAPVGGDKFPFLDASGATAGNVTLADLMTALQTLGVPQIATGSYVGTGTCGRGNKNSITFPFTPKLVFLAGPDKSIHVNMFFFYPNPYAGLDYSNCLYLTWGTNMLQWYYDNNKEPEYQFNTSGGTYRWIAIK